MSYSFHLKRVDYVDNQYTVEVIAGDTAPDEIWITGHTHDGSENSAPDHLMIRDSRGYYIQMGTPYPARVDVS